MPYRHSLEVDGAIRAADRVVSAILGLVGPVRSVVDLGGGTGAWCRAFKTKGVERVLCLDHPDARSAGLLIDEREFRGLDLAKESPNPIPADLAISVEFAEHVSAARVEWVVNFLTQSARVILFSAAVPGQGGIAHVNEQWPSFWAQQFGHRGFTQLDVIRPLIVADEMIPYWYRQNLFLYAADPAPFSRFSRLLPAGFLALHESVPRVLEQPTLRAVLRRAGPALIEAVAFRLRRLLNFNGGSAP
jgi:hypothetical protein